MSNLYKQGESISDGGIYRDDVWIDNREAVSILNKYHKILQKILHSGAWYPSALEFKFHTNGELMYREISEIVDNIPCDVTLVVDE